MGLGAAPRDEESSLMIAMRLADLICLPMALKAALDLKVFEIIAAAGPHAHLTPQEMVAKMPTSNPYAAAALDRILRLLVTDSILTMSASTSTSHQHAYGLTQQSRLLLPGEDGLSVASLVQLPLDKASVGGLYCLKDHVLEGGPSPFDKAHGMDFFAYACKEPGFSRVFQDAMSTGSRLRMGEVLEVYGGRGGFKNVKQVMDVGGGVGTSISAIVARFPHVRGINFDMPHVVAMAPHYPGVEHVGGNMFEGIPSAETIFMKCVLHDWDDEHCIKLLRNCWKALPELGKVINVELALPAVLSNDAISRHVASEDVFMLANLKGGKERTVAEYANLAKAAGFEETTDFPISIGFHVLEFHKKSLSVPAEKN
ncbi:hypothetical protein ACLOJK_016217 [Asimina triloba]